MIDIKLKKREAADFLNRKGRRIEIIFFGLILIFVSLAPIFLYSYLSYIFSHLNIYIVNTAKLTVEQGNISYTVFWIFAVIISFAVVLFLTVPMYSCFFSHSYKIYRDGIAGKAKYFEFGEYGYWGGFRSGLLIFVILVLCLAPTVAIVALCRWFATFDDIRFVALVNYLSFIAVAVGIVFGFFIFLFFKPLFLFGYYIARGKKVVEALSLSQKQMKTPRANEIYRAYIRSFIPSLLLSLATLLVLFLLDTLPKMSMVYFDVADEIIYGE